MQPIPASSDVFVVPGSNDIGAIPDQKMDVVRHHRESEDIDCENRGQLFNGTELEKGANFDRGEGASGGWRDGRGLAGA